MTRVKRSVHARKKRRATLERAKGYRGEAHSSYRRAKEALMKADSYAYRDRRNRKRDFRRLWITRINAAARQNGMSYGDVHARPQAGRDRDRPQGPRRHRRARCRHLPPICRGRPRGVAGLTARRHHDPPGAPPPRTGALFFSGPRCPSPAPTTNRSRRSASSPAASGATSCATFVAEGEDLIAAADGGGLGARAAARRGRLRAGGRGGRPAPAQAVLPARLGHARDRHLRPALGARAGRPAASRCGASATRATSAPCCARALAFGAGSVALGPGTADPYGPQGGARLDGRDLLRPRRAREQRRRAARPQGGARGAQRQPAQRGAPAAT